MPAQRAAAALFGAIAAGAELERDITSADIEGWRAQGIELLAAEMLCRRGEPARWPADAVEATLARRRDATAVELAAACAIRELLDACQRAEIGVLLLKGAALAYTLYPAPWVRPRQDTDLLVDPGAEQDAADLLKRVGYEELPSNSGVSGQRQFVRQSAIRHTVDLHTRLAVPSTFGLLDRYPALAARAASIPALGPAAAGLAFPDALLHACVHRVAHHNDSPAVLWLYDIHLLAAALDMDGWERFARLAARTETRTVCASGLRAARALFATSVPPAVVEVLRAPARERSAAFLGGRLTEFEIQRLSFCHLRSWRARMRLLRAHLFPPAPFMLARYRRRRAWLPLLYVHRIVSGAAGWFTLAGRTAAGTD